MFSSFEVMDSKEVVSKRNRIRSSEEIVGVINGDITSDELTIGDSRSLYNGTATVILRSTKEPGKIAPLLSNSNVTGTKKESPPEARP